VVYAELTFLKELISQNRVRGHFSPYPDNPSRNFLLVQVFIIHRVHAVVYPRKVGMNLLQSPTRRKIWHPQFVNLSQEG